jgi:transposase InsO family protein
VIAPPSKFSRTGRPRRTPPRIPIPSSPQGVGADRKLTQLGPYWFGANSPEYISTVTLAWAAKRGIRINFIQPGQPQQNAYVECYNRTVRYDWLAHLCIAAQTSAHRKVQRGNAQGRKLIVASGIGRHKLAL